MNRIKNIKAFATKKQEEEQKKQVETSILYGNLIQTIEDLKPRIKELIETATVCLENGIEIEEFVTNYMSHKVGFSMTFPSDKKIYFIGINGGGYCGNYNFRTDGIKIYEEHIDTRHRQDPTISHMKKFLQCFDDFENKFYKYIDTIIKE